jgi:hypothetical protein
VVPADNVARKERFLKRHPEWVIVFVRSGSFGYHQAKLDEPHITLTSWDLGRLMDKVETAAGES